MNCVKIVCPQSEAAELYALNRLEPAAADAFEEHLLVCPACANTVEFADEFVSVLRAATLEPDLAAKTLPFEQAS